MSIHYTIFDTPVLKTMLYRAALIYMKIFRWKRGGAPPSFPKYVMIAAPHTSNWDLVITLILAFAYQINVCWVGKHTIFRPPFGSLFRWLGGIPVDRRQAGDTVAQSVQAFHKHERLIMIVPPEGTRKKVRYWKTGFYYIAHGAGVPIVLGYVDYARKIGGFGPAIKPTGDIHADMNIIKDFYKNIEGKHGNQWSSEGIIIKK
ncbi:MAG: hypothetical protein CSYNP_03479 [Syntrophus sp. SKADARSKE-3]|nr:hypothetical protein [Syntrophus sp. SKADARSKE-3]